MTALIIIVIIVLFGAALLVLLSGIALYARLVELRAAVGSFCSHLNNLLREHHDLTAEAQFRESEGNIAAALSSYNAAAWDYNIAIETFPAQIIAKLFHLNKVPLFDTKKFLS